MIPAHWTPVTRDSDDERVGYLEPTDAGALPRDLLGHPAGPEQDADGAAESLREAGLSYLADRYLLALPGREGPLSVLVVEVDPAAVTVQNNDSGYEGDFGARFTLDVPVAEAVLRPERAR